MSNNSQMVTILTCIVNKKHYYLSKTIKWDNQMKLRFLCGQHRAQLNEQPEKAIHCWQNGFDTGQLFCEQHNWAEALPHLGCAFEAADIILTNQLVETESACELFVASATLLLDAYGNLDYLAQSQEVYWMAMQRLTNELANDTSIEASVAHHLDHLYKHLTQPRSTNTAALNEKLFTSSLVNAVVH